MRTKVHRSLAWLLSACMVFMLLPMTALAAVESVTVESQSGTLVARQLSTGEVTFPLVTTGTATSSDVTFTWYQASDKSGGPSTTPTGITISATATDPTIAISATTETTAGMYYFTATIDAKESNVAALTISTALTLIGAISGTAKVGNTLTAGAVDPHVAVSYQWQSATDVAGPYTNIEGATSSTYTLVAGDAGKFIKVVATATATGYTGSVTSAASDVVADADYTLSIGNETLNSGVGQSRSITVGGTQSGSLSGKYLVVAITEGSGDTAKVSVVMFELTKSPVNISYQTAGATVEAWLVSTGDMPSFTGETITGDFVAHDQAN